MTQWKAGTFIRFRIAGRPECRTFQFSEQGYLNQRYRVLVQMPPQATQSLGRKRPHVSSIRYVGSDGSYFISRTLRDSHD